MAKWVLVGDFKQLLLFLILLFCFRPFNMGPGYIALWHIVFTGVLLSAIFNCPHSRQVHITCLVLGIPTFVANWASIFYVREWLFILALMLSLIFLVFAIFSLLQRVILGKVNADTLRGTICVYFMIGFAFALGFTALELLVPHSFKGLESLVGTYPHGNYHPQLVYFSYITLLAIGYGDITPLSDMAQMLVVGEGLIGQFYLAILVGRIVSVFSLRAIKDRG